MVVGFWQCYPKYMYLFWISRLYKIQQQQLIDPKKQYGFYYVWILTALKLRHLKKSGSEILYKGQFTWCLWPFELKVNWGQGQTEPEVYYWFNPHILQNLINQQLVWALISTSWTNVTFIGTATVFPTGMKARLVLKTTV